MQFPKNDVPPELFIPTLANLLELFVRDMATAQDFVASFYELSDQVPHQLDESIRDEFDTFCLAVADFEACDRRRRADFGLINIQELKHAAQIFLSTINEKNE